MSITRKELTEILIEKTQLPARECAEFVDQLFEIIAESLEKGEKVKISGFGNFSVREKRARKGRNPQTGEQIEISARRVVTFKASHILRNAIAESPDFKEEPEGEAAEAEPQPE
ncbi:MAG TPA: integration host factor subunit alpha [Thermodesulfobacteriota bacterium]|nr:integration host factor subunit alpha [Thermodesulfobacteriota bacterium]